MIEINPSEVEHKQVYKLLTGSLVPRPIAWVSTVSSDGVPNLAPFSFFTAVWSWSAPPMVLFCPGTRGSDGKEKDTYYNVKATGEFVVNFVNEATAEAMNITATEVPADVNEFERAGLTAIASKIVNVPRVKESPIQFECKLHEMVHLPGAHIVIGEIVYMHFDEAVYKEGNYIDIAAYQPIGRLAGNMYAHIDDLFKLIRPPSEIEE
jgi:flavin reductase (DIM6/NTAB) family NADH-FMN oxidoreductase RutF